MNIKFYEELKSNAIGFLDIPLTEIKDNKDLEALKVIVALKIKDVREAIKKMNDKCEENNVPILVKIETDSFDKFILEKEYQLDEEKNPIYKYQSNQLLNKLLFKDQKNVSKEFLPKKRNLFKGVVQGNKNNNQKYTGDFDKIKMNLVINNEILPRLAIYALENNKTQIINEEILNEYRDILVNWIEEKINYRDIYDINPFQTRRNKKKDNELNKLGYTKKQIKDLRKMLPKPKPIRQKTIVLIDEYYLLLNTYAQKIMPNMHGKSAHLYEIDLAIEENKIKTMKTLREIVLKNNMEEIKSKKNLIEVKKQKI